MTQLIPQEKQTTLCARLLTALAKANESQKKELTQATEVHVNAVRLLKAS